MKIYLRDRNLELVEIWKKTFEKYDNIFPSCGDMFSDGDHLNVDAIISPANSFGHMDGGIDYVYSEYFGWNVSFYLRSKIWQDYDGELLVGQSIIIDIENIKTSIDRIKYLISAPTMRVPTDVSQTVNAYLSFKSALKTAKKHNIQSLLCPGLATSIGKMSYQNCAKQMLKAYEDFLNPVYYDILGDANKVHLKMIGN